MKQPKLNELRIDKNATRRLRAKIAAIKKIKITINVDSDILADIRKIASENGAPYQTMLNRLLREAVAKKSSEQTRLDRLEKTVAALQRRRVA